MGRSSLVLPMTVSDQFVLSNTTWEAARRRFTGGDEMADEVLIERRGRVLLITLNRPEARNAINSEIADGLGRAFDELDGDAGLRAGVLTGAGKGFCSGMDLK